MADTVRHDRLDLDLRPSIIPAPALLSTLVLSPRRDQGVPSSQKSSWATFLKSYVLLPPAPNPVADLICM